MTFRLLTKVCKRCHHRWESEGQAQECFLGHVRPEYQALADSVPVLTHERWEALFPMNTYEMRLFIPHLDDAALVKLALYYKSQCSPGESSYDGALIHRIVPLLCDRLMTRVSVAPVESLKAQGHSCQRPDCTGDIRCPNATRAN